MRHSQTTGTYAKAFLAFSALAILGACTDNNSAAPTAEAPAIVAPANFNRVGNAVTFRVSNGQGITQRIGQHLISIPANAICELGKSGYGATYWDMPCTPLKGSIVITAVIMEDADGMPYVDFQPAMRFAPNKEVMLFLRQGKYSSKKELLVQYCNVAGTCVDESLADPSVKPFRIGHTPVIARRVKHFSGYAVVSRGECSGTVTDNGDGTYWCEDGGFSRRSGYMVASGEDVSTVMNDKNKSDKDKDKD